MFGDHSTENDEYGDSDDEHTETWALNDSDGVDIEGADGRIIQSETETRAPDRRH